MLLFVCSLVQDYENEAERFRSILDLEDGLVSQTYKRSRLESPALKVKGEVNYYNKLLLHRTFFFFLLMMYRMRPRTIDMH